VIDLRPFELDAILHFRYRRGQRHDHKLELLGTGHKTLDEMSAVIASVFEIDPSKLAQLALIRADLTADLRDIDVLSLSRMLRVRFKRTTEERGELDYDVIGGRRLEYMRYGKSPNCIRIYDKPAECRARFAEILRRANPDAEPPTFEEAFGFPEDTTMTRVERQIGGKRFPPQLETFGQLGSAREFDPFKAIEIIPNTFPLPDPAKHGEAETVKLIGTHRLVELLGFHRARALLNANGNASRLFERYQEYLNASAVACNLTRDMIFDAYEKSTAEQIEGKNSRMEAEISPLTNVIHLPPKYEEATHSG
jgi:hypothetical protein